MLEDAARLIIPDEDISNMVLTLCKSGYWIKVESLQDGKSLIVIRKDV
jgi:hypothetical protein